MTPGEAPDSAPGAVFSTAPKSSQALRISPRQLRPQGPPPCLSNTVSIHQGQPGAARTLLQPLVSLCLIAQPLRLRATRGVTNGLCSRAGEPHLFAVSASAGVPGQPSRTPHGPRASAFAPRRTGAPRPVAARALRLFAFLWLAAPPLLSRRAALSLRRPSQRPARRSCSFADPIPPALRLRLPGHVPPPELRHHAAAGRRARPARLPTCLILPGGFAGPLAPPLRRRWPPSHPPSARPGSRSGQAPGRALLPVHRRGPLRPGSM